MTRGGKSQRRPTNSRSESGKRITATDNGRLGPIIKWKSRLCSRGGRKHGQCSTRSRPKAVKSMIKIAGEREIPKEKSSKNFARNAWNGEVTRLQVGTADNASSSERSEYDDENGQATGDEYDYLAVDDFAGGLNGKADDVMEGSDYNIDGDDGDEDDVAEDADDIAEEERGNFNVGGYINENSDEQGIGDADDLEDSDPYVKPYGYSTEASSDFSE